MIRESRVLIDFYAQLLVDRQCATTIITSLQQLYHSPRQTSPTNSPSQMSINHWTLWRANQEDM